MGHNSTPMQQCGQGTLKKTLAHKSQQHKQGSKKWRIPAKGVKSQAHLALLREKW